MKKIGKIVLGGGCLMTIICIALMLICNQIVVNNAERKVYSDIDRIKYNKVGLLLGTTPQARFDRITKDGTVLLINFPQTIEQEIRKLQ